MFLHSAPASMAHHITALIPEHCTDGKYECNSWQYSTPWLGLLSIYIVWCAETLGTLNGCVMLLDVVTGAKVTEETTLPAALLMNLIFLCGLFTFAVVLGFVSEEIKSQLRAVKAGNYRGMSFTCTSLTSKSLLHLEGL